MTTATIRQRVTLPVPPKHVYEVFMSGRHHAAFTGLGARIQPKVGGKFLTCGTFNWGWTLFLVPGKRIVQALGQKDLPKGYFTILDIRLKRRGRGTVLEFTQHGVPKNCINWLAPGWKKTYWEPLRKYLEMG
jgi:uncharacterized protein YndB with AHSA1/START domain